MRPGPVSGRGLVDAMLPRNFLYRPAGAKPARPRVSPPEPVASLAPSLETGSAKYLNKCVLSLIFLEKAATVS